MEQGQDDAAKKIESAMWNKVAYPGTYLHDTIQVYTLYSSWDYKHQPFIITSCFS